MSSSSLFHYYYFPHRFHSHITSALLSSQTRSSTCTLFSQHCYLHRLAAPKLQFSAVAPWRWGLQTEWGNTQIPWALRRLTLFCACVLALPSVSRKQLVQCSPCRLTPLTAPPAAASQLEKNGSKTPSKHTHRENTTDKGTKQQNKQAGGHDTISNSRFLSVSKIKFKPILLEFTRHPTRQALQNASACISSNFEIYIKFKNNILTIA